MSELSMMSHAFVRPCAAGHRHLGGLALHSDEVEREKGGERERALLGIFHDGMV
jgi:hypothetical protein